MITTPLRELPSNKLTKVSKYMILRALLLILISTTYSFANDSSSYLSTEQKNELNRRSAMDALKDLYVDPNLVREGRRLKENQDQAILEVLVPPKLQTVKDIKITRNRRKIDKVFVYPNQITSFTITDSMGEPWPLKAEPIVASDTYSVSYSPESPGFFTLETKKKFVPSSLVLPLEGRLRPLQFQLFSDNTELNYMVDIVVEGMSPSNATPVARPFNGVRIQENDSKGVSQFLDVAPENAVRLPSIGDKDIQVWKWEGYYVIRSPYILLDPSNPIDVQGKMDSAEKVYLIKNRFLVAAFLNDKNNQIINIEIAGDYK